MTQHEPTPEEQVALFEHQWIDPVRDDQPHSTFQLYPQPSRRADGSDPQGSYQLYLPPGYADDESTRYPVLYWLHGGFQHSRQDAVVERIDRAIRAGTVPPCIVVLPQALPIGWYVDSKDNARPIEQVMVHDLISHVDAAYRTLAVRESRWIEGFSMGGFGAFHLAFKHPTLFGRVSALAPSILRDIADEPAYRVDNTFFGDEAYYNAVAPWGVLLANAPQIRELLAIRLCVGTADTRLYAAVHRMRDDLAALDIPFEYHEAPGAAHVAPDVIDGLGDDYPGFWQG
jgi:enterochelin esterase-like enzyme